MRFTALNTPTRRSAQPKRRPWLRLGRAQQGQAIVLIALLILVLFGMLGLAVDSGRGYVDRRDQQTAVDAAALAAGDWWDNTQDLAGQTIPGALAVYQSNLRLYGGCVLGPDMPPNVTALGYPQDNWNATCTGTSYTLAITAINTQFNGYQFTFHSYHQLPLAFIQIFGGAPTIDIEAQATSIVGNQRQTPALLTLDPNGPCSTWIHGNGQLTLYGDAYSNGPVCMDPNTQIAGNCYAPSGTCSAATYLCYDPNGNISSPPCTGGEVEGRPIEPAPSLPDPGYLAPEQQYYQGLGTISSHGTYNEMTPGVFNNFSLSGPGCYFLDAGVYTWNGGYTSHGGFVSNELKPPGEAAYTNPGGTTLANPTFWGGGGGCDGSFLVLPPVPAAPWGIKHQGTSGNWGVVLTSVRFDRFRDNTLGAANPCFAAPGCMRESAPSVCQQVGTVDGNNQGIPVQISNNAPGAEYYNVYIDPMGCEPIPPSAIPNPLHFTFYGTFLAPGWTDTGFGFASWTGVLGTGILTGGRFGWTPCMAPAVTICNINGGSINTYSNYATVPAGCAFYNGRAANCISPAYETQPQCFPNVCGVNSAPQENAPMDLEFPAYTGGDLANENYCVVSPPAGSPNALATQPCGSAKITPGGVQFYFPGGGNNCLDQNGNGTTHVFGGEQYNWIIIYEPSSLPGNPPNTYCSGQRLNGNSYTQYIGTMYSPTSSWNILGANTAPLAGQVIAYDANVTGNGNAGILFNPNFSPAPPAARLVN